MSENLRAFTKAVYSFDHVVRLAGDDPEVWDRPTPCARWTTRDVVGHVLAIQQLMARLVRGDDADEQLNPMEDPGRYAGADPARAWAAARDGILEALDQEGSLRKVVTTFRGEQAVDEMIGFNVADTTIHSWDLARGLGVDERLDPECLARADALLRPIAESMRMPMVFGPALPAPEGADAQTELLSLLGRRV